MTRESRQAVAASKHFEAKKDSTRQNQDGTWKLTLTMSPDDYPAEIRDSIPGQRFMCVLVALADDETALSVVPATYKQEKIPRTWAELLPSQQAGIACNDPHFQEWVNGYAGRFGFVDNDGIEWPLSIWDKKTAAKLVRHFCGVASRAELDYEANAANLAKWNDLYLKYQSDTGIGTEERG